MGLNSTKNKKKPILTIGMPVFNREKFVGDAIESIINQSFTDFIFIISDNCSSDSTQEICIKYAKLDNRIIYIRQKNNIGLVGNFHFLLEKLNTEYFMWAASDDVFSSNWLSTLMPYAMKKGIVPTGKIEYIDADGKISNGLIRKGNFENSLKLLRRQKFLWNLYPHHIYSIFKKDIILKHKHYFSSHVVDNREVYKDASDIYFCYSLLSSQKLVMRSEAIRYCRLHSENSIEYGDKKKKPTLYFVIRSTFTTINILRILRMSTKIEKPFIFLVYFLIVLRNWLNLTLYTLNRVFKLSIRYF